MVSQAPDFRLRVHGSAGFRDPPFAAGFPDSPFGRFSRVRFSTAQVRVDSVQRSRPVIDQAFASSPFVGDPRLLSLRVDDSFQRVGFAGSFLNECLAPGEVLQVDLGKLIADDALSAPLDDLVAVSAAGPSPANSSRFPP